ncbi:MAG: lysophospholipid acyltransferase family protein [Candidatus Eremiobacterota bacterium]
MDISLRPAVAGPLRASGASEERKEPVFGEDLPNYTGPKDGLSHPKHQWLLKPLTRALVAGLYRVEVEGEDNLQREGGQVYCPTHPTIADPILVSSLMQRDVRYMSNIRVLRGLPGTLMTWGGACPVHRSAVSRVTLQHCRDVLEQGKGLCIFPEGGIADQKHWGQVGPLMKGAATSALMADAHSVVPIAVHYQPDTEKRTGEAVLGALTAVAVTAGGAVAAMYGGPAVRIAAAAVGGALGLGSLLGVLNRNRTQNPNYYNQMPRYLAALSGGAVGVVAGGLAGGLSAWLLPELAPWIGLAAAVGGGAGTLQMAGALRHRDLARVIVGDPLEVAPYKQAHRKTRDAAAALTEDLHRALGRAKERLSGVPYDDSAPKFREKVEEGEDNGGGLNTL